MRFVYGFIAIWLWVLLLVFVYEGDTSTISNGEWVISLAIVAAGAMAGGGMK